MTKGSNWTNRLITGLFTAAAAWGSVTVEIRRTVNARAELTEERIEQRIADHIDQATRELAAQQAAILDSLGVAGRITSAPTAQLPTPQITVLAPVDSMATVRQAELAGRLDAIETRLRFVAIAIARIQPPNDSPPRYGPGYRDTK
ncbi:MAG: hypothetical protein JST45_05350 [Bacteroidetes bacterium]|nr:hypothetical protein [Bacteroidota bacterium]